MTSQSYHKPKFFDYPPNGRTKCTECHWCEEQFTFGEKIISKHKARGRRAYYHESCAKRLNIL